MKKRLTKAKFAKLQWEIDCSVGRLMVVSTSWRVCVAHYSKNACGTYTALYGTYKTAEGAKRAIERALVWRGKK